MHDPYRKAFDEILLKIERQIKDSGSDAHPTRVYIAGGAAMHLWTGERVTEDVDATFSRKVILDDDAEVSYRDPDGRARLLYLDRNYNDTLGLLHEDAYDETGPVDVPGIDRKVLDVRVLAPVDLAVSKLARFTDQDRRDIELLAKRDLIEAESLRLRAEQALQGYVGNISSVKMSIDIACRLVEAVKPRIPKP
ncbi:MAG: hypothetical protein IT518_08090 [Burkholderiales bacterium]|nr:hypothetical protein [Burkholderiales bacterium]